MVGADIVMLAHPSIISTGKSLEFQVTIRYEQSIVVQRIKVGPEKQSFHLQNHKGFNQSVCIYLIQMSFICLLLVFFIGSSMDTIINKLCWRYQIALPLHLTQLAFMMNSAVNPTPPPQEMKTQHANFFSVQSYLISRLSVDVT